MTIDLTRIDDEALRNLLVAVNREFDNRRKAIQGNYLFRLRSLIKDIENDGFYVDVFDMHVCVDEVQIVDSTTGECE